MIKCHHHHHYHYPQSSSYYLFLVSDLLINKFYCSYKNVNLTFELSIVVTISASFIGGSGLTCTVTSLIPGTPSAMTSSMMGTCYSAISCRSLGGVAIGRCGATNVCCVCKYLMMISGD